jgi:hypothetical protein
MGGFRLYIPPISKELNTVFKDAYDLFGLHSKSQFSKLYFLGIQVLSAKERILILQLSMIL